MIEQGAVGQLDAPEPDPASPHVEHLAGAVAERDGDPVAPRVFVVPRLDARHMQPVDHPVAGPGVGDGVLVAGVARRPPGDVEGAGRGQRAAAPAARIGDDDLDGQRPGGRTVGDVDTDVEVERPGRAVGSSPGTVAVSPRLTVGTDTSSTLRCSPGIHH